MSHRCERRPLLRLLAAGLLLALGCGEPEQPPNVLIYLVDTLRRDHLSVYGYARETSPRLVEFAADAVRFDAAYSPTSWTKPATASLLSGLSPARHGAITRPNRIHPSAKLLGEYLRPAGYHSAAFVTNPNVLPVWGFGAGFDVFHDIDSVEYEGRADRVTDLVIRHIEEKEREPFFLYVHTLDPHIPYDPPPPYNRSWPRPPRRQLKSRRPEVAERAEVVKNIALYDGEIQFADHHFGRLLDFLKAAGLYEDMFIAFTSDHGEEFREHGAIGHGHTLFEEAVRVPLLVKFPGNAHAGTVAEKQALLVDVVPTLLAMLGIQANANVEGRDLRRLVAGAPSEPRTPRPVFLDLNLAGVTEHRNIVDGIVWGRYKLLESREPRRETLLFDLHSDPKETKNVALEARDLAAHLRELLQAHRAGFDAGVHLWLVNADDDRERSFEGVLRGPFTSLREVQLEPGDEASLSPDRRELHFRVILRNEPNPIDQSPLRLVDNDRLILGVEPGDTVIDVETLRVDGAPAPLFLGRDKRPVASLPVSLEPDSASLRVGRMETLFPASDEASIVADLGAYLGVVPGVESQDVELDPALAERLRALGYLR